jgi:hypothetical protein
MKLHGLALGTQKVYVNAVSRLAGYFHRSPDQLLEQDLRDYFTYLVETKKVPSSTLRTEIFGVKFLFDKTLQRPWPTLKFLRARPISNCRPCWTEPKRSVIHDHARRTRPTRTKTPSRTSTLISSYQSFSDAAVCGWMLFTNATVTRLVNHYPCSASR